MVDVKLSRLTVNEGSRIFPVILDIERKEFTGIRNDPYTFEEYRQKKFDNIAQLINQFGNKHNDILLGQLTMLNQILNEDMDFSAKLKLIQEHQHQVFCTINQLNLANIKPRYNPELLHVTIGSYREEPLPMFSNVHKHRVSLNTILKYSYPEIYKNMKECKNTLWSWDYTYLDKIEFNVFL